MKKCRHKIVFVSYEMQSIPEDIIFPFVVRPELKRVERSWNDLSKREQRKVLKENLKKLFPVFGNCDETCSNQ